MKPLKNNKLQSKFFNQKNPITQHLVWHALLAVLLLTTTLLPTQASANECLTCNASARAGVSNVVPFPQCCGDYPPNPLNPSACSSAPLTTDTDGDGIPDSEESFIEDQDADGIVDGLDELNTIANNSVNVPTPLWAMLLIALLFTLFAHRASTQHKRWQRITTNSLLLITGFFLVADNHRAIANSYIGNWFQVHIISQTSNNYLLLVDLNSAVNPEYYNVWLESEINGNTEIIASSLNRSSFVLSSANANPSLQLKRCLASSAMPVLTEPEQLDTAHFNDNATPLTPLDPIAFALPEHSVNALPHSLEVTPSGAATLSIPLQTPPGTAAFEPQLSINYHSQRGNGLLGVGVHLDGLSTIHRCAPTLAQDGLIDAIDFDNNDRFCLDDNRLIEISISGNQTEYRTEIDSFSRIVAYDTAGNGPQRFTVWTKAGETHYFGHTANSRIEAQGRTDVLVWAVNKVANTVGNYYTIQYAEQNGSYRPIHIDYTGNTAAGLQPYNRITLSYEQRPDPITSFTAGSKTVVNQRLTRINMLANNKLAYYYKLNYQTSVQSWRSQLTNISQCDKKNRCTQPLELGWSQSIVEQTPASIDNGIENWTNTVLGSGTEEGYWAGYDYIPPSFPSGNQPHQTLQPHHLTGDFNGDGKTDLTYWRGNQNQYGDYNSEGWRMLLSGYNAWNEQVWGKGETTGIGPDFYIEKSYNDPLTLSVSLNAWPNPQAYTHVGDYNGDGLSDLIIGSHDYAQWSDIFYSEYVWVTPENFRHSILHSTGSGWQSKEIDYFPITETDYFDLCSGVESVDIEPGNTTQFIHYVRISNPCNFIGDFNGDGLSDLMHGSFISAYEDGISTYEGWSIRKSIGNTFANRDYASDSWGQGNSFGRGIPLDTVGGSTQFMADFNGDGRSDYIYLDAGENGETIHGWRVLLSTGEGWDDQLWGLDPDAATNSNFLGYTPSLPTDNKAKIFHQAGDFNGDGKTDLMYYVHPSVGQASGWRVLFSTGTGWQGEWWADGNSNNGQQAYGGPESWADSSQPFNFTGDFNGDGRTDFMHWSEISASWRVLYAGGNGWHARLINSGSSTPYWSNYLQTTSQSFHFLGDFDGTGRTSLLFWQGDNNGSALGWTRLSNRGTTDVITTITDALGVEQKIEYSTLSNNAIYTRGSGAEFPVVDTQSPSVVVSSVSLPNGIGGTHNTSYRYQGMRIDRERKRCLGFEKVFITDEQTGIVTTTEYFQTFPHSGIPKSIETRLPNAQLMSSLLNTVEVSSTGNTHFPYINQSILTEYQLNDNLQAAGTVTTTTDYGYDNYGNLLTRNELVTDGNETFSKNTVNTYNNNTNDNRWILGRLTRTEVTHEANGQTAITKTATFDYDPITGLRTREVIEPDMATGLHLTLQTYWVHNIFGNIVETHVCPTALQPCDSSVLGDAVRSTLFGFDARGQFATNKTNPLGQTSHVSYEQNFGNLTSRTAINGLSTAWQHDSLGKKILETKPDGTQKSIGTVRCSSYSQSGQESLLPNCNTVNGIQPAYLTINHSSGSYPKIVAYDTFRRPLRSQSTGFNGQRILVDTQYNNRGQVAQVSEPYVDGSTRYWRKNNYDLLNRVTQQEYPDANGNAVNTEISYQGFSTTTTNALSQTRTKTVNAMGLTTTTTDPLGNTQQYQHDSLGNKTSTIDSEGNITTYINDLRGRLKRIIDPDLGNHYMPYNSYNEKILVNKPINVVIRYAHDKLGRLRARIEDNYTTINYWHYDNAEGSGIGQLHYIQSANGDTTTNSYDDLGRIISQQQVTNGESFTLERGYDDYSRLSQLTYPISEAYPQGLKLNYHYNDYGFLSRVQSAGADATVFWEALNTNARGQITSNLLGNGVNNNYSYATANGWLQGIESTNVLAIKLQDNSYNHDSIGNLTSRQSHLTNGLHETFAHDDLNRITSTLTTGGAPNVTYANETINYDALGNITEKTGMGSYTYGTCNAGPHAVCSANGKNYSYNDNGSIIGDGSRTITYSPTEKPLVITEGPTTTKFLYGADNNRIMQSTTTATGTQQQYYVGLGATGGILYQREDNGSNPSQHQYYIYGASSQPLAVIKTNSLSSNTQYYHRDHLGSVEAISDELGYEITRISHNIWGQRRELEVGDNLNSNGDWHFTGQERIAKSELIHMNGRVYDPVLAQFISADPIIQYPYNQQSYNRYSYVRNSPLKFTDPSGYSSCRLIGQQGVAGGAVGYFSCSSSGGGGSVPYRGQVSPETKYWARVHAAIMAHYKARAHVASLNLPTVESRNAELGLTNVGNQTQNNGMTSTSGLTAQGQSRNKSFNEGSAGEGYAEKSVRGAITETKFEQAFDENGQAIIKRGQYGDDTKINLPAQINFIKKALGKSLNIDVEISMRTTGEFQRYDEYSREVRYIHTYTNSVLTGDTDRYSVSPWQSTGQQIWNPTNINVWKYPVNINLCSPTCF